MELYLLRHADAGDPGAWDGPDERRPLSRKGVRQAERLGRFLADVGFEVDAILTSPKLRAAETARLVADALGARVTEDERLGSDVTTEALPAVLRDAGSPDRVMIVGHDPDFSELLATLCDAAQIPMKKGALARVDLDGDMAPGAGVLRWLVPPDLLRTDR
jgi:phosphohistidine phosphatase